MGEAYGTGTMKIPCKLLRQNRLHIRIQRNLRLKIKKQVEELNQAVSIFQLRTKPNLGRSKTKVWKSTAATFF